MCLHYTLCPHAALHKFLAISRKSDLSTEAQAKLIDRTSALMMPETSDGGQII